MPDGSSPPEVDGERIDVAGALGGSFDPDCARVQPARLVRGLADVVRRLGVEIHEQTRVTAIEPGLARTESGTVRAPYVLRCLEGYTAGLAGQRRTWLPMNSAIVVTEPLTDAQWDAIGWRDSELLGDLAHAYCYAQRTADGRIALGGRGIPYRYGSRTDVDGRTQAWTIESLRGTLADLFPPSPACRWRRPGAASSAYPGTGARASTLHPATGLGWAGGYVGNGLSATNLAGRTLRDLVLDRTPTCATRLDQPPGAQLGARAVALAGGARDVRPLPDGGPARDRKRLATGPAGSAALRTSSLVGDQGAARTPGANGQSADRQDPAGQFRSWQRGHRLG